MKGTIHTLNIMVPFVWLFTAAVFFLIGDDLRSAVWGFVVGFSVSFGVDFYDEVIVPWKNRRKW